MFGLGFTEILVILAVVLIVVGPSKLPEFAKTLGKSMFQLKRAADDFRREVNLSSLDLVSPDPIQSAHGESNSEKSLKTTIPEADSTYCPEDSTKQEQKEPSTEENDSAS